MAKPPEASPNHEAIPAQQPLAASPGPDLGQRRAKSGAGVLWTVALALLLLASLGVVLSQNLN